MSRSAERDTNLPPSAELIGLGPRDRDDCALANGWKPGQPWHDGSENFEVLREWNRALVYRKTIAYFADRLAQAR